MTENPIDRGRAAGDHIGINHHVGQASIACQRMLKVKLQDGLFFPFVKPVISRDPAVVFVDSAVFVDPAAIRGRPDPDPLLNLSGRDFSFLRPFADVVHDLITNFMGHPFFAQGAPLAFLAAHVPAGVRR